MRLRGARGWVAALVVGGVIAAACGLEKNRAADDEVDDPDGFSERLYDGGSEGSIWNSLDDSERGAVERSGMSGLSASAGADAEVDAMDAADEEGKADKYSKMTLSVLVVAISAAAAAAPFLLF